MQVKINGITRSLDMPEVSAIYENWSMYKTSVISYEPWVVLSEFGDLSYVVAEADDVYKWLDDDRNTAIAAVPLNECTVSSGRELKGGTYVRSSWCGPKI